MRKFLLILSALPLFYFGSAQNSAPVKCLTCKEGKHDGMVINTLANTSLSHNTSAPHTGNGNSTFGQSYLVQNLCGFNYVVGSVNTQTRATWQPGTGFPTTITIAGLPPGFIVQAAFLYYGCSYTEPAPPATTVTITNPTPATSTIASTMIGQGGDVCWGAKGTCGYRCDVTPAISGNGNYQINLNGFANAAYEVDGCTLIITYIDPAATYSGSMALWDGNIIGIGTQVNYTGTGFTACTASSNGSAFGLFGDIQNNVNGGNNTDDFNGSTATFTNDFWNTNVVATSVAACQTTAVFNSYVGNSSDCVLWTAAGLYWQYATCTSCNAMTVTSVDVNPSCGNNNGSITVNVVGGTAPYTYTWAPNISTTSTATGLAPGTYQITVNDAACNVQTISVTLVMVSLNVTVSQTNILCAGQANGTVNFSVSGGTKPYTYNWNPNVSTDSTAINLSAGSYTVSISDLVGCTYHDTITITSPPVLTAPIVVVNELCNGGTAGKATATAGGGVAPYTYSWTNGSTTDSAVNLSAGTYTLTLKDANGCSLTASATITQPAQLTVHVTGPQTICANSSGTLKAIVGGGTAPYTFSWNGGPPTSADSDVVIPANSQTYTVNVTDANGCQTVGQFTVILGPPLTITTKGPTSTCAGNTVTICATAGGGTGGYTYLWTPGNLTGPCIVVSPSVSTTYSVTVFDNCGSQIGTTKTVAVNPLPNVKLSADLYQGCSPLCIQFRNKTTVMSGGLQSYVWTFGNGDTSHAKNPTYCYPNSGIYSVSLTVVSDSGCSATLSDLNLITVFEHPNASFSLSPQPATIISPNIQFTDMSTSQYGLSYWWWNFGDGVDSTSNLENPSHTFQDTGSYCAKLVVMDIHGCTDTATNCLVIDPVFNLYIPDAFSPNGDGKNEVFMPKGQYIKTYELYIFDRWGMQLFHSNDINNGWNGTVKGGSTISQEDTYVYKIYVTDSKNKQHSFIGNVTILK